MHYNCGDVDRFYVLHECPDHVLQLFRFHDSWNREQNTWLSIIDLLHVILSIWLTVVCRLCGILWICCVVCTVMERNIRGFFYSAMPCMVLHKLQHLREILQRRLACDSFEASWVDYDRTNQWDLRVRNSDYCGEYPSPPHSQYESLKDCRETESALWFDLARMLWQRNRLIVFIRDCSY